MLKSLLDLEILVDVDTRSTASSHRSSNDFNTQSVTYNIVDVKDRSFLCWCDAVLGSFRLFTCITSSLWC